MKYLVRIKREDNNLMSTIVDLPYDYLDVWKNCLDIKKTKEYDDLLENQVSDNIYFEGQGWEYLEVRRMTIFSDDCITMNKELRTK